MVVSSRLGRRIREFRMKKGLTQMELAAGLCTASMISQIESGRANPSFKMLNAIAERMEVSPDSFLGELELVVEVRNNFSFAKKLVESGSYDLAMQYLNKLLQVDVSELSKEEIQLQLAICYRQTGQPEEAELILSQIIETAPLMGIFRWQVLIELSATLQDKREYQVATYHLLKVFKDLREQSLIDPDLYVRVIHQLAELYKLQGKNSLAVNLFQELLSKDSKSTDPKAIAQTYMTLAEWYMSQGEYSRAQECASHAQAIYQEMNNQARRLDAQLQLVLLEGRQGKGRSTAEKLIRIAEAYREKSEHETVGAVYAEIAAVYLKEGNREAALKYAEEARHLLSNEHSSKGKVYRTLAALFLEEDDTKGYSYLLNAAVHFEHHRQIQELEEATHTICSFLKDHGRHTEALERMQSFHAFVMETLSDRGFTL